MSQEDEVSREDVVAGLEQFQEDLKVSLGSKSLQLKALVGGASTLGMLSSFLLGRKSGKKRGAESDSNSTD
ncbi:MAG: hypothetical protein O3B92_00070 [Actinobacteria bacterium]|nr:hypothetical protein [Actinomycetota bacterium]MDA3016608.1 hypothetical protein [Actinomycetota bacterium]